MVGVRGGQGEHSHSDAVTGCRGGGGGGGEGVEGLGVSNHSNVAAHCDRMLGAMGGTRCAQSQ